MMLKEEILELLRTDQAFRAELRRQLLTEELLALPERFDRLTDLVGELIEAQQRTEQGLQQQGEQIKQLGEQIQRQSEQIRQLGEQIQQQGEQIKQLIKVQWRTEAALHDLINWQMGEDGRRRGERYEREVIKSAPVFFSGGRGGAPDQPWVQERLTEQLKSLLDGDLIEPKVNPFLADLIWWKGERVAVVEVSYLVNGHDVERAAERAETIRRTGVETVAIVMGKDWATEDTPGKAIHRQVEWYVGTSLSEGYIEFRRAPSS